jgi:large subunit ribosomal protein L35
MAKKSKQKTRRSAAKRFKVTGTGKIMRRQAWRSHLVVGKKSSSRMRRLDGEKRVDRTDRTRVRRMLGR